MNGIHDCGGMMGFGPVVAEANEPVFHAPWEARMFALMSAVGDVGGWTLDDDRSACESMEPQHYLATSYYEHWLHGAEVLLVRHGLATPAEIVSGRMTLAPKTVTPTAAESIWGLVTAAGGYRRDSAALPLFKPGDRVRARSLHPRGHTRLPRYLRGHAGEIVSHHGAHVYPDSNSSGHGEDPQHLYTVRFRAAELWGNGSRDVVHADLWEPYLEAL